MPQSYGYCSPGGPIDRKHGLPIPVDPTLTGASPQPAPRPAKPTQARTWGSRIPDHIRAAIVRERVEGDSATTLATRYGISRQRVYAICREVAR